MKGKKPNSEFVANFISANISNGISSSQQILATAKERIQEIDRQIMAVSALKKERSGLLDVIEQLNKGQI